MATVQRSGCRLRYEIDGNPGGPPVLFSNSLGTTCEMWKPQVDALSSTFRLIRYDTRGHGASDVPPGPYTLETLALDALAILEAADVDRAHICGLSLGGLTAMWLAVHRPDRVQSVTLASTAARIGNAMMWEERIAQVRTSGVQSVADAAMERWFSQSFRAYDPDVVAIYNRMLSATPAEGYAACCAAIRDADLRPTIHRISAPALVLAGHHDPVTPPADAEDMRSRIPDSRVSLLDAAHILNVEQARAFNELLSTFITQQETSHG
ncbi:MAG: 3-oxoadipate enol-lactonase [Vicinamibacterales bacterium]